MDTILVQGNKITEEDIILRELTFGHNDTVTQKILNYNEERIYSLGLFTKVDLSLYPFNEKYILIIDVEESWYIYPIPVASLRDNDWDKLSYGFYLVVKNFRGRNETIITRIELGYDPAFNVSYYKPNVVPGSDFFWGAEVLYTNITNKSNAAFNLYGTDFSQKYIIGSLEVGKRFGSYQRLSTKLKYNYVESPKYFPLINASTGRVDRYPSIVFGYSYDTRDLAQFPREGVFGSAYLELKGLGLEDISYQVFGLDYREYRKVVSDLTAKWRFSARFTSGKTIPYYDFSRIGYDEKIRGNYNKTLEGNNYYVGSIELFYPLIKDFNISFDFIPIVPKELLSYRVALFLELFGDTGAAKLLGNPLKFNDFRSGYGIGVNLLVLPYNILRFELAFDEYQNSEFILGLGISF
ncbi:MAG: BamA/TamA family outer membrane protein [Ignavibacteriaceae bacterium]|nr:BamA/TamA family outer membrane protein [Ignavibacteriaceae bacterium]